MAFRLGVVSHSDTYHFVETIVSEYFDSVEIRHIELSTDDNLDAAALRIVQAMPDCDGLLYSRYDPYLLVSGRLIHSIPARYVGIDSSHLIASLLRGIIQYHVELTDISIDNFGYKAAVAALESVGVHAGSVAIRTITADLNMKGFVHETLAQHIENHNRGSVLCVTNITAVCSALTEMGIPAVVINPSVESFVHEIRNLMLRSRLTLAPAGKYAAILVETQYKDRYRFYREMPLREIDEYAAVGKLVHVFAERLDGAVFTWPQGSYGIVCDSDTLSVATDGYSEIQLMRQITDSTAFDVKVGVGLGSNAAEAAANSRASLTRANEHRGSAAFIITKDQAVLGPIVSHSLSIEPDGAVDDRLIAVSTQSGIRFDTVHRLYQHSRLRQSILYTSTDLAGILGVTTRTANTIIGRLVDSGYAAIVGKSLSSPKGRPHRVIKLLI